MKKLSFGQQITISFSAIAITFFVASYIVNYHTGKLTQNIELVDDLRLPTSQASKNLTNGISQSLAALRGWLLLADPQFIADRNAAWQNSIDPAFNELTVLSANWTNTENIKRLDAIRKELEFFQHSQEEITQVAHTADATPATKLLTEEAKPLADSVLTNITALIEITSQNTLNKEEEALFKNFADFRGSFAQSLASVRLFLITADVDAQLDFKQHWAINEKSFTHILARSELLNSEQKSLIDSLKEKREAFSSLARKLFSIRISERYNTPNHLLKTKAAPSAKRILAILNEMVADQRFLLKNEITQHEKGLKALNTQVSFSILSGLILTLILGFFTSKSFKTMSLDIAQKTKEFKDSVETIEGILETSKDAIVSIKTNGIILSCNTTTETMFGYNRDELIGKNINMLMPEPHRHKHDDYLAEHMRTGIKKPIWTGARELIALKKDGTTFTIVLSIGSVTTDNEQIFTGFIRDITAQKTAQEKLETLNKRLTIQNTTQEQVARINEMMHGASDLTLLGDNIIIALSELIGAGYGVFYAKRITEETGSLDNNTLSPISTYGLHDTDITTTDIKIGQGLIGQCAKTKSIIHTTDIPANYIPIRSGLGQSTPQEVLILPLTFEQQLLGVIELATFTAITEQQKQILNTVRHDIGIVINNVINIEQTKHFLQMMQQQSDELHDQSEKLKTSNAYKSDFLATMSHEIRTPINGVIGMLSSLVKTKLDKDQLKKATMAQSSAQSLLTIINDILDFSKIESGKLDLELLDFDITTLFEELAELMAIKAQDKGLAFNLDLVDIQQPMVKGDASRLRQIITNLCGNAIKFTHEGDITLKASLRPYSNKELQLICSITDSGIGITDQQQQHLFEAFRQADASTTRKYGGTGLGLSICKNLCELMGGKISVASTKGKGSHFEFNVLLDKSLEPARELPQNTLPAAQILVADGNSTSRDIICRQLQTWGAEITRVNLGSALLTHLNRGNKPDMIFMATDLPDANIEKLFKEIDISLHTKTVLMCASHNDAKRFEHLSTRLHMTFTKPITPSDLFDAVASLPQYNSTGKNQTISTSSGEQEDPALLYQWPPHTRVMLVEDNFVNQETMKFLLEDINLVADIASDGKEAITMLQADGGDPYTLILMDCQMPVMDGFTATANIRDGAAGSHYQTIPIIALTANARKEDRERCIAAGMSDYLSKPVDVDALTAMLQHWSNKKGVAEPANTVAQTTPSTKAPP